MKSPIIYLGSEREVCHSVATQLVSEIEGDKRERVNRILRYTHNPELYVKIKIKLHKLGFASKKAGILAVRIIAIIKSKLRTPRDILTENEKLLFRFNELLVQTKLRAIDLKPLFHNSKNPSNKLLLQMCEYLETKIDRDMHPEKYVIDDE